MDIDNELVSVRINGCLAFQRDWEAFVRMWIGVLLDWDLPAFLKDLENFSEDLDISFLLV